MTPETARAVLTSLAIATGLTACRTTIFYTQAVHGQWEVLSKARPIDHLQKDPATPARLRRQLELVERLRTFAHDTLKLPTDRQYRNYTDLKRPYVVWNVVAAPEFSLEAKTWYYPFLGRLKYRGYFNEASARTESDRLKAEGYDVVVGGVRVYSTLGVFSDPVLNTFVNNEEAELAETLFHELTHARLFIPGDTDFNEAYATASAQLGVRAWLQSKGDPVALEKYQQSLNQAARLLQTLRETQGELKTLYAARGTVPDAELSLQKALVLNRCTEKCLLLKRTAVRQPGRPKWTGPNLNNARLAALATYHDLEPGFVQLFEQEGRDWEAFHRAVAGMRSLSKPQRRARLGNLPHPQAQPSGP